MQFFARVLPVLLLAQLAAAQSDRDFSGLWKFNPARSELHGLPTPPDPILKIEQTGSMLTWSGSLEEGGPATASWSYPLDGKPLKRQVGDSTTNTVIKWEGVALLVNTLVSGPENYTVMERWSLSRNGRALTVRQSIVRLGGETESLLVYDSLSQTGVLQTRPPEQTGPAQPAAASPSKPSETPEYVVEPGTRLLLRLTNSVNTKYSVAGDRVYLETAVPVFVNGRLVIPRGSYVSGTVLESRKAGRVKGKSELSLRFESLTLPNGVTRNLRSLPGSVDTRGNLDRTEGKIEGEGNKGGDARTVGATTAAGAGVGTLAGAASGHYGMGAGIGAAAGAAAGLAGVLGSRGPDVVLPQGTTMELVLDRQLRYTEAELGPRVQ